MRFARTWQKARLTKVRQLSDSVREFTLEPLEGPVLPYAPGSHINIGVMVNERPDTRSYSLVGLTDGTSYTIAVKLRDDSRGGSAYLHGLSEGALVDISDPQALFGIDYGHPAYLLVAGGIGITPLVSFAETLQARGAVFHLAYCARNRAEMVLTERLEAISGDRWTRHVSDEGTRLDLAHAIAGLPDNGMMLICAPLPMIEQARQLWQQAGRDPTLLRFETFGTAGTRPTQPFDVRLGIAGQTIHVPANMTILEALSQSGIDALSDCRRGECGLCAVDVLAIEGEIDHRDMFLSSEQKREGRKICLCVSRAVGTIAIDTAYRAVL